MVNELKNNPINTCLIQISFSPILIIEKSINDLQEIFRKTGFPIFKEIKDTIYTIDSNTQETSNIGNKRWVFISLDEQELILLDKFQITLQVTKYTNFGIFIDKFNNILNNFSSVIDIPNGIVINKIGLRYANCVENPDNFKFFFKQNYHGLTLPESIKAKGFQLINSTIRCLLDEDLVKKTNLLLRVYQNDIGIMIPMNILALKEKKSDEFDVITFFDLDLTMVFNNNVLMELKEISKFAQNLNDIASKIFFDSITKEGEKEWQ